MEYNKVNEVLKEKERSQRWLAEKVGMSANGINLICRNKTQPRIDTLYSIADVLGVSVCDLLNENPTDGGDETE